jgi:dynein heavy chain, axonemal
LDCYFKSYEDTELKVITPEEVANLESMIEPLFIYAMVWSLCCTVDAPGREAFNE